jgi:sulfonate transport system permease protein
MTLSRPAQIIGGMLLIAVVAWGMSLLVSCLEKFLCPWKREVMSQ